MKFYQYLVSTWVLIGTVFIFLNIVHRSDDFQAPIADTGGEVSHSDDASYQSWLPVRHARLPNPSLPKIPTQSSLGDPGVTSEDLTELNNFIQSVTSGDSASLTGVFVDELMALRIVQQPVGEVGFISSQKGTATQFQSPSSFGVVGLLAHNYLSGERFHQLQHGENITLIYGDGRLKNYQVTEIVEYERITNGDLRSDFRSLKNGDIWTADQVFDRFYRGNDHLALQTCIEKDGVLNWGVKFVVAEPVDG